MGVSAAKLELGCHSARLLEKEIARTVLRIRELARQQLVRAGMERKGKVRR